MLSTLSRRLFRHKKNVAYGAIFLKAKHKQHGNWEKAIGSYHSSTPKKASSYHAKVKKTSNNMDSYKKNLAKIENASYKKTTASKQKFKKSETKKLQVSTGLLKENNWFRKI